MVLDLGGGWVGGAHIVTHLQANLQQLWPCGGQLFLEAP